MAVHSFTDAQVHNARHALGLTRQRNAYRNYFFATYEDPDWEDLVARGMAVRRSSPVSEGFIYHLTQQSAFYFLNNGERLDPDLRFPPTPTPDKGSEG